MTWLGWGIDGTFVYTYKLLSHCWMGDTKSILHVKISHQQSQKSFGRHSGDPD